ncbi:glycolate oxidase subunit GlcE [Roseivivax marinus]|uniref:Glycolate oxidase subunit GlcE n=1 Tax=Roseivivax marinus TaxID=1379903 RepID=W4HLD3_9RHOB|nr:FAD-binding protein [Roseivivax marinus]ETW12896.1 glycolate oxidase subunit GlcE [Roseivivax marinus]
MRPETEDELAEIVTGARGPFAVRGGGTRGMVQGPGDVLETGGLTGISLYEPGALTLVVRAGTPLAEVETALAAEGQRLAFEPMDHRGLMESGGTPTIGGVVAANVSGPRRIQAGACRDALLGVRFVDGAGRVVRNGGRVMKNVTGYDLVKLLAGSRGALGVLTEVSLKVLPVPETQATLVLRGLDAGEAVAAMSKGLGSPFEVTGAAHLPAADETCLRIEGFADSVAYRLGRLAELFPGHDAQRETDPEAVAARWAGVRDVAPFHGRDGDVWRVSVRPSAAPDLAQRLGAEALMFDWGGGLIWALTPPGHDLRAAMTGTVGHATLVRAAPETHAALGTLHPEPAAVARLTDGLRRRFDPNGLFSGTSAAPAAA